MRSMARRMFSTEIVNSDIFLDMPSSTQSLYFHLGMHCDDDGFVYPKKVMRMVAAVEDDLKILLAKKFLLTFESGVIVIKHWRVNNYIRADRYRDTSHRQEFDLLEVDRGGVYHLIGSAQIPEHANDNTKEKPEWLKRREAALSESSLPYSFTYKIRKTFVGRTCPVCEHPMGPDKRTYPSLQHNTPLADGGKHELGNISVICTACNVSIRDKKTGKLNSDEVIEAWKRLSADGIQSGSISKEVRKKVKGSKDLKGEMQNAGGLTKEEQLTRIGEIKEVITGRVTIRNKMS